MSSSPSRPSSNNIAVIDLDTPSADEKSGRDSDRQVGDCLGPINEIWTPTQHYDDADIGTLVPGPQPITLTARIVNFFDQQTPSKAPQAAKGCFRMIMKDNTGALTVRCNDPSMIRKLSTDEDQVRLWYASVDYHLRLGQLVSIWTTHVSTGGNGTLSAPTAPLFVSMFPERDRSCHFMAQNHSDSGVLCKMPLGYRPKQQLPSLFTLQAFIDGAHEDCEPRILVAVKSLGPKKTSM